MWPVEAASVTGGEPASGVEEMNRVEFVEDVRAYREERLAAAGRRGLFPLWGRDTTKLAGAFVVSP